MKKKKKIGDGGANFKKKDKFCKQMKIDRNKGKIPDNNSRKPLRFIVFLIIQIKKKKRSSDNRVYMKKKKSETRSSHVGIVYCINFN